MREDISISRESEILEATSKIYKIKLQTIALSFQKFELKLNK